jgi:hypothetical protein
MTLLMLAKAAGHAAQRFRMSTVALLCGSMAPGVIVGAWFVATFGAIVWVSGLDPLTMASPDEAVSRLSASLIRQHGRPFLWLSFPDPEDLAHPRHWVSVGDKAIPVYAPVALYYYALLLRLGTVGLVLIAALPASSAAAFAAGIAKLLPASRRWLAGLAPLLGFPALYWLAQPWMNLSVLLICVCWAFFFWASWRETRSPRYLAIALFVVGAGAAVRPDYAAYLLLVALLFAISASPSEWKRIFVLVTLAGAAAVALNLALNNLVTGNPLLAAYQIVEGRDVGGGVGRGLVEWLRELLLPMGLPTPRLALHFLIKYWLKMGALGVLLVGQLTLVPILLARPPWSRLLCALGLAVILGFMASRMDPGVYGASAPVAMVHHSIPRYWAPVYLLVALPPLLFLGRCRKRSVLVVGAAMASAIALSGAYEIVKHQPASLSQLRRYFHQNELLLQTLAAELPSDAMVYSIRHDKVLWSRWRVGTVDEPERTATSIDRAIDARLSVFVFEPGFGVTQSRRLASSLRKRHLALVAVDPRRGLYRIERERTVP